MFRVISTRRSVPFPVPAGWRLRLRTARPVKAGACALPAGPWASPRLRSGARSRSSGGGLRRGGNGGRGAGGAGGRFCRDAGGERGVLLSSTWSFRSRFVEPFLRPSLRRSGGQRYPQFERQEAPWLPAGQRRQPRPQRHHPSWWGTRRWRGGWASQRVRGIGLRAADVAGPGGSPSERAWGGWLSSPPQNAPSGGFWGGVEGQPAPLQVCSWGAQFAVSSVNWSWVHEEEKFRQWMFGGGSLPPPPHFSWRAYVWMSRGISPHRRRCSAYFSTWVSPSCFRLLPSHSALPLFGWEAGWRSCGRVLLLPLPDAGLADEIFRCAGLVFFSSDESRGVSFVGGCFKESYEAFLSTAAHWCGFNQARSCSDVCVCIHIYAPLPSLVLCCWQGKPTFQEGLSGVHTLGNCFLRSYASIIVIYDHYKQDMKGTVNRTTSVFFFSPVLYG